MQVPLPPAESIFPEPFSDLFGILEDATDARYPLPKVIRDDNIIPNLLNDRLFYLTYFSTQYPKTMYTTYECFLWEMFGTSPGCLLEFFLVARSNGRFGVFNGNFVQLYLNLMIFNGALFERSETFDSFLSDIEQRLTAPDLVYSFKSKLEQLRDRLLGLRQEFTDHHLGKEFCSIIS